MKIEPYLFFEGRAEEAIAFYKEVFGAKVELLMRQKESPEPPPPGMLPPGSQDKIMHATLRIGDAVLMVSDGRCSGKADFQGFALSVPLPDAKAAASVFEKITDGGQVRMPLAKTFWSPCFGMVADRFGVVWMITVME